MHLLILGTYILGTYIYMYIILRSEKKITSNKASRDCHMKTLIDLSITFYLRHWTGYKIVTYACLLLLLHFFFKICDEYFSYFKQNISVVVVVVYLANTNEEYEKIV